MSFIFNLEFCEYKEGPIGPQMGPLAFNCLHTPFYTPILSLAHPVPATPITTTCNIMALKKSCSKQLEFWVF